LSAEEAVIAAPLAPTLRKRLVGAVERGSSARQAAARFAVSASAAIKLLRRVRETGSMEPGKIGGHGKPLLARASAVLPVLAIASQRTA
jgi:transposase